MLALIPKVQLILRRSKKREKWMARADSEEVIPLSCIRCRIVEQDDTQSGCPAYFANTYIRSEPSQTVLGNNVGLESDELSLLLCLSS